MSAPTRGCFIDGEEHLPTDGTFDSVAAETGELLARVARGSRDDVDLAVRAARCAFLEWANAAPTHRERILLRAADLIEARSAAFIEGVIDEGGGTIGKARREVAYTSELLRAAAGEARRLMGDTFPNDAPARMTMVMREPLGVVAVISPFNAPLALLAKMAAFPLAAGNTIVAKPSEDTPLIALDLARVFADAGLPAGVFNVVTGFGEPTGMALVAHPEVDGIAFTGSTAVGAHIAASAAPRMRRLQLELGGKNALVVLRGADVERAAAIAAEGAFAHAGQICMASSRIIVERPEHDAFVEAFVARARSLFFGRLREENTAYGPLIHARALDKVKRHIAGAQAAGARLATGGHVIRGRVVAPTILTDVTRTSEVWREETFGPVACVVPADDVDDAVRLANDTAYGLSAAVVGGDAGRALGVARRLRAGSVHVGMASFQSNTLAPIGGYGLSGVGRSGGKYGVDAFTELKWLSVELGMLPHG